MALGFDPLNGAVVMNPIGAAELLRGPTGPVMRMLIERATLVQEAAKRQVRVGHVHGGMGRPSLRDTIVKRIVAAIEPTVRVGSNSPIALLHHEGTRPHVIFPRTASALYFYLPAAGGFVFAKSVNHPGTKPNRYLTDNLWLAIRPPSGVSSVV